MTKGCLMNTMHSNKPFELVSGEVIVMQHHIEAVQVGVVAAVLKHRRQTAVAGQALQLGLGVSVGGGDDHHT